MDAIENRRQYSRAPFIKKANIFGFGEVQCLNLSIGGMCIEKNSAYPTWSLLNIQFKLYNHEDDAIMAQCTALPDGRPHGVGLAFINLKSEDRKKIEQFIYPA